MTKSKSKDQLQKRGRKSAFRSEYILIAKVCRQRTLEALTTQIEAISRQSLLLMIFEDVHWIDPTSLKALDRAL